MRAFFRAVLAGRSLRVGALLFLVAAGALSVATCSGESESEGLIVSAGASGSSGAAGSAGAAGAIVDASNDVANDASADAAAGAAGSSGGVGGSASNGGSAGEGGNSGSGGASIAKTRYPASARHSPMSDGVISAMRQVIAASPGRHDVFAKVGDSITVNGFYLYCFANPDVKLGNHTELAPTIPFFNATPAAGNDSSFKRVSVAAKVGWSAGATVSGAPSPIDQEITAISPSLAVVMLGTNNTYETGVGAFDRDLLKVVDRLLSKGVVPLISTIPPRGQSDANALVPEMNAVIRAIAQQRQIPLMDYWQTLIGLAGYGLASDGVHPQTYTSGGIGRGCWLTDEALSQGVNQRNLITLEALDRARRYLVATTPDAAEATPNALVGMGSWEQPFEVDSLPFVDDGDTRDATRGDSKFSGYSCGTRDESGREVVYKIKVTQPTTLSIRVFDEDPQGDDVDVDLQWLTAPNASSCVIRDDKHLTISATPGTYYLAVDTYAASSVAKAGVYRLTIVAK